MGENQRPGLSIEDELWARVIAQEMVRYARAAGGQFMAGRIDSEAVRILSEIKKVLDNPSLDDQDCLLHINAIVDVFYEAGLSTRRHETCE